MKFGLILAGQYLRDAPPALRAGEMLEQVRLARDLGFDSVWMVHHYLIEFQTFQPLPMLARIAADAGDMAIGTAIYVLPLQHPVEVAENFATLDALSGGRLIFGVAQGYRDAEFQALGIPRKERAARFEEGLALITRLWTEERVTFHGRYYRVDGVALAMAPARKPRPPIWIGAGADAAIARAARVGDAWMIGPGVEFATVGCSFAEHRRGCPYGTDAAAAFMPAGTRIHSVRGYATDFRLAAVWKDSLFLYQAWRNPRAKVGSHLYDIAGKVRAIDVQRGEPHPAAPRDPVRVSSPRDTEAIDTPARLATS